MFFLNTGLSWGSSAAPSAHPDYEDYKQYGDECKQYGEYHDEDH
jgi:hypothetical protein